MFCSAVAACVSGCGVCTECRAACESHSVGKSVSYGDILM